VVWFSERVGGVSPEQKTSKEWKAIDTHHETKGKSGNSVNNGWNLGRNRDVGAYHQNSIGGVGSHGPSGTGEKLKTSQKTKNENKKNLSGEKRPTGPTKFGVSVS